MKYNGVELKDIADVPQLCNPPRAMLVWDDDDTEPTVLNVYAIIASERADQRVIASDLCGSAHKYGHCAELPRFATYQQVSEWLARGNGEVTAGIISGNQLVHCYCKSYLYYFASNACKECNGLKVRRWGEDWHEPTLEYLGLKTGNSEGINNG